VWGDLEPFLGEFDPTTAQLLRLVNGEGKKLAEAATNLRISSEDAMARYRASNFKLYALYRQHRQQQQPAGATVATKPAVAWSELRAHLGILDSTERQLVEAVRDRGQKVEEAAPHLGLEVKKAKGMLLSIARKLNQAYRGE
jgi:hypothetical protein